MPTIREPDITSLTLVHQLKAVRLGEASVEEITKAYLDRIRDLNPTLNAYVHVDPKALESARTLDQHAGQLPLKGAVLAVKANLDQAGIPNDAGTRIYRQCIPARDADVIRQIREAGAVVLGRTNLHELAAGMTTSNPHTGVTRNPLSLDRIPGGSSGGAAAAVAARLASGAIGSDTGGSIRIPAALCGVVGVKPTYGVVSTVGLTPLAWSLDNVGPLTRTVADATVLLDCLIRPDWTRRDEALQAAADGRPSDAALRGWRIGIAASYFDRDQSPSVVKAMTHVREILIDGGAVVRDIELPRLREALLIQRLISQPESVAAHPMAARVQADVGADVRRRMAAGARVSGVDYIRAMRARLSLTAEYEQLLSTVDALIAPATGVSAIAIGAQRARVHGRWRSLRDVYMNFSVPFSLSGQPVVVLPVASDEAGLPIAVQVVASRHADRRALAVASVVELAIESTAPTRRLDPRLGHL